MQDFKPNPNRFGESKPSATAAPEKKKVGKVISGKAATKPKGELAKFADTFIAGDIRKVKDYLIKDVIVPTIRDTIWTVIAKGSERLLYGDAGHAPKKSKLPYLDYNGLFKQNAPAVQSQASSSSNPMYSVDNILLDDEDDAKKVLATMHAYIAEYGSVSISELYEFIDEPVRDFTSTHWGWRSINTASYTPTSDGRYKLNLPRAVSLK